MEVKTINEKKLNQALKDCDNIIVQYVSALKNVISAQEHTISMAKKKIRELSKA